MNKVVYKQIDEGPDSSENVLLRILVVLEGGHCYKTPYGNIMAAFSPKHSSELPPVPQDWQWINVYGQAIQQCQKCGAIYSEGAGNASICNECTSKEGN